MAWEWSYSFDAEGYAEEELHKFSRETLLEIAEEWKKKLNDNAKEKHARKEDDLEEGEMKVFTDSMLADWIWEQASSWEHGRTCSNGAHEIYICPHGCHTVDLRNMPKDWSPEE
jgi:hypothetical protein